MTAAARSPRLATLMFGALFIYLVAVLFHLPVLFFMSAALVLAPLASYWLAAGGLSQIRAERRLPSRLWPDERVEVELRLEEAVEGTSHYSRYQTLRYTIRRAITGDFDF